MNEWMWYLLSNADCVDANVCTRVDVNDELQVEWKNYVIVDARDALGMESPRGIRLAYVIIIRLTPVYDVIPRRWLRRVVNGVCTKVTTIQSLNS